MSSSQIPNCPPGCMAAHTFTQAMFLLGVGRTRFYQMIHSRAITYLKTPYGKRIMHGDIKAFLESCERISPANGHQRTEKPFSVG